jgi:NAD(P)-dependent dehydrogenase (short-subunit alcohol dehydrogenase family)
MQAIGRGTVAFELFHDDTALVTGAAKGIGRAIATRLAKEGVAVALADIEAATGNAAVAELVRAGYTAHFIATNLAEKEGPNRLFDATLEKLGRISILVHSASPPRREKDTYFAVSDEVWEGMVAVNLKAAFLLGRLAGQHMIARNIAGRILFITSLHAETPRNLPHYSAAKAGTTMVMKELARLLGPKGIRVNALAPGAVAGGGFVPDPALVSRIPLGRMAAADDIAAMAMAVLSDRFGGYVTGTTVVVDGGIGLQSWIDPPAV